MHPHGRLMIATTNAQVVVAWMNASVSAEQQPHP